MSAWDELVAVDLEGPFLLTQAFLPALQDAASMDDPARVSNIGSIHGIHVPSLPTYACSSTKPAVHQLTRHLAKELGRRASPSTLSLRERSSRR